MSFASSPATRLPFLSTTSPPPAGLTSAATTDRMPIHRVMARSPPARGPGLWPPGPGALSQNCRAGHGSATTFFAWAPKETPRVDEAPGAQPTIICVLKSTRSPLPAGAARTCVSIPELPKHV